MPRIHGATAQNGLTGHQQRRHRAAVIFITAAVLLMPGLSNPAAYARQLDESANVAEGLAPGAHQLDVSMKSDRKRNIELAEKGAVAGKIFVFVVPDGDVTFAGFYIDPPSDALEVGFEGATPYSTDDAKPFDLSGTEKKNGQAKPFDTRTLANGPHSIFAKLTLSDGRIEIVRADIVVHNGSAKLLFGEKKVTVTLPEDSSGYAVVDLFSSDEKHKKITITETAPWLEIESEFPGDAVTTSPGEQVLKVDTTGLEPGTYSTTVTATSSGTASDSMTLTAEVTATTCTPIPCSEILVDLPYQLDFSQDHGKILDGAGVGTGLSYLDPNHSGAGYIPANLAVNTSGSGTLNYTTTNGISYQINNSQDNALAVGIDAPSQVSIISTTLLNPAFGTGKFEQAGLWFGNDQDNYVKFSIISQAGVNRLQFLIEEGGVEIGKVFSLSLPPVTSLKLDLRVSPSDRSITASYSVNGTPTKVLGGFIAAEEFFSFDAAGIDPEIGTRSFAGIYATHRNATSPVVYQFDAFSVVAETTPPPPLDTAFTRTAFGVPNPTSMAIGPDGRLYVTEMLGKIHAFTLDEDKQMIAEEVITTLGARLTLGLTIDPLSTPENIIVWVSHSSPSLFSGELNSGIVSRLSGPGLTVREDIITGLPRAIANHGTNSLHFGPDGRLYIAQGGNTGAGAANQENTEFGTRAEQPLSSALLVADVRAEGFDGTCATPEGAFAPAPCSVTPYATGMRNMYDFVFHTNGSLYGADNGLGVTGTYPPNASPPCTGFGNALPFNQGGDNPGSQPDILLRIEPGGYYGHPNPARNECVFKDGGSRYYSPPVSPLPNYQPAIHTIGSHTSSNGIIEYHGDAFDGDLRGQLLYVNYSAGDDLRRIKLAADGRSVIEDRQVAVGFNDPLALTQDSDGAIYVGEFGSGKITVLNPTGEGSGDTTPPAAPSGLTGSGAPAGVTLNWAANTEADLEGYRVYRSSSASGPFVRLNQTLLTATTYFDGSAPIGETSYYQVTAEDTSENESAPSATVNVDRPATGTWTTKAPAPASLLDAGSGVVNDIMYLVAGKTLTGPQRTLYAYNPATNSWSTLASLPTAYPAVENPAVVGVNGKLYIFGGSSGPFSGSTTAAAVYDPVSNAWTMLGSMTTGRGGAVALALNGKIYVIGGMDASGVSLASVEVYDIATNTWSAGVPMGTARDNPGGAVLDGKLYIFGGRTRAIDGTGPGTLSTVEMFDPAAGIWTNRASMPTGRRTPVVGLVGGKAQVMGGERKGDGSTFAENEEYDPVTNTWRTLTPMLTPRHGAGVGTINGVVYVSTGGPIGGSSFTTITEAFTLTGGTIDTTPPAAPTGLTATGTVASINLDWGDNTENDMSGYHVYRGSSISGPFTRITTTHITGSSYADSAAPVGATSYYQVTAVDTSANESAPSSVASALRPGATYQLVYSTTSNRANPLALDGRTVSGNIFAFTTPDTADIVRVRFWLDNPSMNGTPYRTESGAPYDFNGGATAAATAYNTNNLSNGTHSITARIERSGGTNDVLTATFTVVNGVVDTTPPAAPTGLGATGSTNGITLDWADNTETDLAGYYVYRSGSEAGPFTRITTSLITESTYIDTTALAGATSYYQVTAVDSSTNESAPSATASADRPGGGGTTYSLVMSTSSNRANPVALDGRTVSGNVFVFTTPDTADIVRVRFWLDNPAMTGAPWRTESGAPYDFNGGTVTAAAAFNTTTLSNGTHSITATIERTGGQATVVITATFTVQNP